MGADSMNELYIQRSSTVAFRRLGDEAIAMSASNSTVFSLNEVATVLWESADGLTPLSEIVQRFICQKFDVEPEEAMRDAEEFAHKLAQHGILLVSDQPFKLSKSCAAGSI
jgi:hypothetical protein